jgi:hypothetical protein
MFLRVNNDLLRGAKISNLAWTYKRNAEIKMQKCRNAVYAWKLFFFLIGARARLQRVRCTFYDFIPDSMSNFII